MIGLNTAEPTIAEKVRLMFERQRQIRSELEAVMLGETKARLIDMAVGIMAHKNKEAIIDVILEDYSVKEIASLHQSYTSMESPETIAEVK